ncbi:hypothetical protein QVD17_06631 [Tagetes erecta]|uniref:Uncharacterized protein n=1 Tax=Tagetes erecta TaxID=13708 RepID=A0AAD8LH97_TARER|nr:hypothetical protein QVD17_06631 [Tagetes erecta]
MATCLEKEDARQVFDEMLGKIVPLMGVDVEIDGSLSPYVGKLSFLGEFSLANNNFHGIIPDELGHLKKLNFLELERNKFNGFIPTNLSRCFNLQVLDLSINELIGLQQSRLEYHAQWISNNKECDEVTAGDGYISSSYLRWLLSPKNKFSSLP